MTSSERNQTGTPGEQADAGDTSPSCCGGDFAAFISEGSAACSPGKFMGRMARPRGEDTAETDSCPIARMCEGMMKGGARGLGLLLLIPAAVLLTLGAAILLIPKLLSWLVAGGLTFLGVLILVMAYHVRQPRRPEV